MGHELNRSRLASGLAAAAAAALLGPALGGAPVEPAGATTPPAWTAYTADNSDNLVFPLNLAAGTVGTGIATGSQPTSLVYSPNGATLYVADKGGTAVQEIATSTNTISTLNSAVGAAPDALAVSPDGATLWVANFTAGTVVPVSTASGALGTPISLGAGTEPDAIAVTPDGSQVLVVDSGTGQVSVISTPTRSVVHLLTVNGDPDAIALTPAGNEAVVADGSMTDLAVISLPSDVLESPITLTADPVAVTVTADGSTAWVASTTSGVSSLTPVTLANNTVGTSLPLPTQPFAEDADALAITPDDATLYAGDANIGDVVPMTVATKAFGTAYTPTPGQQDAIFSVAVEPDQAPSAAFSETTGDAGDATTFNASSSSAPVGSIATYSWNFGDGTTETTNVADVSHTYATSGSYTATLTVTDSAGTSTSEVTNGAAILRNGGASATTSSTIGVSNPPAATTTTTSTTTTTTLPYVCGPVYRIVTIHRYIRRHGKRVLISKRERIAETRRVAHRVVTHRRGKRVVVIRYSHDVIRACRRK